MQIDRRQFLLSAPVMIRLPGLSLEARGPVEIADAGEPDKRPAIQIAMLHRGGGKSPGATAWKRIERPKLQSLGYTFGRGGTSHADVLELDLDWAVANLDPRPVPDAIDREPAWLVFERGDYRGTWYAPGYVSAATVAEWIEQQRDAVTRRKPEPARQRQPLGKPTVARRRQPILRGGGGLWRFFGGDYGMPLRRHLARAHGVPLDRTSGLSNRELRIIHSNRHRGYPAFGLLQLAPAPPGVVA